MNFQLIYSVQLFLSL